MIESSPRVVAGGADTTTGPRGVGRSSYVGFDEAQFDIDLVWVELLTDRAYTASVPLDARDLPRGPTGAAELVIVIGPNGLLIVADDEDFPGPQGEVTAICATRTPAADTAWRLRHPLSQARLTEALADTYPPVSADTRCKDPGQ